ncbi:hypothetical protein MMC11_002750 [Xylographa trunciseda]|nr:hypothetical protein [Xylographa trunciseda]
MAKEAYREMIADQARLARENPGWGWPGQPIPGAMAVLAVDDPDGGLNLVFASAIKGQYGGTSFILQVGRPDNEGKNILLACQNIYAVKYPTQSQPSHKTNANCAEPLAIYAYYEYFVKPADKIKTKSKPGRFAVWGPSDINAGGEPMDPCSYSYSNVFGCKELLIEQNINAVRTNVAPTDPDQLPKPAGSAEVCVFPENIRGECCTNSQRN